MTLLAKSDSTDDGGRDGPIDDGCGGGGGTLSEPHASLDKQKVSLPH